MKTWKVGDTIPFRVRCTGDPAQDNPTATVYDETDTPGVPALTIGAGIEQVGSTKIITGSFVADAAGEWSVTVTDDTGMDLVKEFIVRDHSVESVGNGMTAIAAMLTLLDAKVSAIDGGGGHFG